MRARGNRKIISGDCLFRLSIELRDLQGPIVDKDLESCFRMS